MRPSLSSFHSVVGLLAGIVSITGAGYSTVRFLRPATGEVVAVIREAHGERPVPSAILEVLTPQDELVTTLTPAEDGCARQSLSEGTYRVRATHPHFNPETRQIRVQSGQTAEVRFLLTQRGVASAARPGPVDGAALAVNKGVNATRRFLRGLGL